MTKPDDARPSSDAISEEERAYFLRRATEHRQLAEKARESATRQIHEQMQALYEMRAQDLC